ncbi:penicillin acylase family protein [Salininema proteolyticum]|uniref:Penicillin acylase family protein n=1 Tax=Salininema proteolyticum TaxID=1607685 RepID=A0ABV8TZZ5_9ACTN
MSFEIHRDAWGIPHLTADDALELAYAQGWNAAQDRAWQLETARHRAEGTLSTVVGAGGVDWDRFARGALIADTARKCHRNLDGETRQWLSEYVRGVNDGLARFAHLAPEFARTGTEPGTWRSWTPLAHWIATHILFVGFPVKLFREQIARVLGEDAAPLFAFDGPGVAGSNGWMLGPEKTGTGLPLLAGDPHRYIEEPGTYQQIHLVCDEFDVVGLTLPGIPGVQHFGHAGSVAWGITNATADAQDLYRERLRRNGDAVEAWGPDGWEDVRSRTEVIDVAGGEPLEVEILETARGPVIAGEVGGDGEAEALSLRCPTRTTADLGFSALPILLRAKTVADVDRAWDEWTVPVNVVMAADADGGMLHRAAGRVPDRDGRNMLFPVPAWEREHEWRGWKDMPRREPAAVHAMANESSLAGPLGREFAAPHRYDRIREILEGRETWEPEDMALVHTDTLSHTAGFLLDLCEKVDGLSPRAQALRERLRAWDRRMDADSRDAALFARLRSTVVVELEKLPPFADLMDGTERHPAIYRQWLVLRARLGHVLPNLFMDGNGLVGAERRDSVLKTALETVAASDDEATWSDLHRLNVLRVLPEEDDLPGVGGDHDCVLSTSSAPGITDGFRRGSVARWVWDVSDRSRSLWIVPFGASGIPGDPHARDQFPLWAKGRLAPVVTDRTDMELEYRS